MFLRGTCKNDGGGCSANLLLRFLFRGMILNAVQMMDMGACLFWRNDPNLELWMVGGLRELQTAGLLEVLPVALLQGAGRSEEERSTVRTTSR